MSLAKKLQTIQLKKPHFVYVGDCGVDVVDGAVLPGGCALNVTYHLHQLGEAADVVTWVGTDTEADKTHSALSRLQVNQTGVHVLEGATPGQTIAVSAAGEKNFTGYQAGVLANAHLSETDLDFIGQHQVLITLFYTQIGHLFDEVTALSFDGIKVVDFMNGADFNFDIGFVKKYSSWFEIAFFGLSPSDEKFIAELHQLSNETDTMLVVTLGEAGSQVFWQGKTYTQPAMPIETVVDTTGAGDAYLAGFIASLLKDGDVEKAMNSGAKQAVEVLKVKGAVVW